MKRLGFGYGGSFDLNPAEVRELALHAEALGYDSVWLAEAWGRDALMVLSSLATITSKVKLGTAIVNTSTRAPGLMAQTIATVDEISKGRFVLGLGAGNPKLVAESHGLAWEKPLQRMREYVEIVRLVLSGESVDYNGQVFHMKGFKLGFKPYRSSVPIYIGSISPKSIHLSGEIADGWMAMEVYPKGFANTKREMEAGAKKAGRDPGSLDIASKFYVHLCTSATEEQARRAVRKEIAYRVGGLGQFHYQTVAQQGFEEECKEIKQLWSQGKSADAINRVTEPMVDGVAFIGSADKIRQKIESVRAMGIGLPILGFSRGTPAAAIKKGLEALAPKG